MPASTSAIKLQSQTGNQSKVAALDGTPLDGSDSSCVHFMFLDRMDLRKTLSQEYTNLQSRVHFMHAVSVTTYAYI